MPAFANAIPIPPPIVPAPMIATFLISRIGVDSGTSGIFAAARSPKNAWRIAFDSVPDDQLLEARALELEALFGGQVHRRLDAVDDLRRGGIAARRLRDALSRLGEECGGIAGELGLLVAQPAQWPLLRDDLACEGERAPEEVALGDLVDQAGGRLVRGNRVAGDHHVERRLRVDRARQALRAAGAGQDPELHFGQRELRAGRGDAVVAAERELEPAAHRDLVDRRDHRFRARLEHCDHLAQVRSGQSRPAC